MSSVQKCWCWNNHENCLLHLFKKNRKSISLGISISLFLLVAVCNKRTTKKFNTQMKPRLMTYRIIVLLPKIRGEKETDTKLCYKLQCTPWTMFELTKCKGNPNMRKKKMIQPELGFYTRISHLLLMHAALLPLSHKFSSWSCSQNFGRLNFDIHWLKLYKRILFVYWACLRTMLHFFFRHFVGFLSSKTHKFCLFFSSSFPILFFSCFFFRYLHFDDSLSCEFRQRRKRASVLLRSVTWSATWPNVFINEILLAFPIDVVYHNSFFVSV